MPGKKKQHREPDRNLNKGEDSDAAKADDSSGEGEGDVVVQEASGPGFCTRLMSILFGAVKLVVFLGAIIAMLAIIVALVSSHYDDIMDAL